MEPMRTQMVFCCAEQWMGGLFYQIEPCGDGLTLDCSRYTTGLYCMLAIDSGENGFQWGRAVLEAELPPDTALRVYAYASDTRRFGGWADLDDGIRSLRGDPTGALREIFGEPAAQSGDFWLERSGRYLWLMFELAATGRSSPAIRALRLWMRGDHMVDYLPAIYQGEDFTRRFLSIFDSVFTDMEQAIDGLPGRIDFESAGGELLRYLASWVCVEQGGSAAELRQRIRTALSDYELRYTPEGVRQSVRRLTGRDAIVIEHFRVSPNRPDCSDPELYRRLYGEDPYRFFVLLPDDVFAGQRQQKEFQREMEELIPAGMSMQTVRLKECVQLDWHTYLGVNSRVAGYVPAAIDEQVTIHYDTTIGGKHHE